MTTTQHLIETPLGWMLIQGTEEHIHRSAWISEEEVTIGKGTHPAPWKIEVEAQVKEYFDKKRKIFQLPLLPDGSEFQQMVWEKVYEIPFGITKTYASLGSNDQARAIGTAVGANPLLLFIPCHRVIGSDGAMHGYAAGTDRKEPQQLSLF
jgi:methylated-DNA-[protein]-cysteine S-methyltransferase